MNYLLVNYEFFDGLIAANPMCLILDILLIVISGYVYYKICYRKNMIFDLWHCYLIFPFFISTLVMYPFAGAKYNYAAEGILAIQASQFTNYAFLINFIGYIFMYCGLLWYITQKGFFLKKLNCPVDSYSGFIEKVVFDKTSIQTIAKVIIVVGSMILLYSFYEYGFSVYLRWFAMRDGIYRIIYNSYFGALVPICGMWFLISYMQTKNKKFLYVFLFVLLSSMFSGSRTTMLICLVEGFYIYYFVNKKYIKTKNVICVFVGIFLGAFVLDAFRSGNFSEIEKMYFNIFYGKTFSDIRDFAIVISHWDGNLWFGKSYLAGVMAFIPREFSDFRGYWSVARQTTQVIIGMDDGHPGYRIGLFGEAYFNFGILGVCLNGLLKGVILAYLSEKIKQYTNYIKVYSLYSCVMFLDILSNTAQFWKIYTYIVILICLKLYEKYQEKHSLMS